MCDGGDIVLGGSYQILRSTLIWERTIDSFRNNETTWRTIATGPVADETVTISSHAICFDNPPH